MKIKLILVAILLLLLPTLSYAAGGAFTFTLPSSARTSAGVYKPDGTLVRTIWSGEQYNAGTYTKSWDGLTDEGVTAPDDTYSIKVLSNSVQYEWEGAYIGNSSEAKSGPTRFRVFDNDSIQNITSTGGKVYVASGYAEGWPAEFHFDNATANSKVWVGKTGITASDTTHVATDGTKVFWAGFDPFQPGPMESFVFVTSVADNSQLTLTNSVNAKMEWDNSSSVTYKAISHKIETSSLVSGLAVQKTGDKLFVTRGNQNELQVLNKNTGALIKTIPITNAGYAGIDTNDNLWMVHDGNILEKYTVNADGTLTSTGIKITSMSLPGGFGFSPDGTTIAVSDVTNQIVKGFNTTTGAELWILGTPGGYLTDSTVTNDKFYFRDVRLNYPTFVHYMPDGSFYINDGANLRLQHYNADRTFRRSIMMQATSYVVQVVKNEPTRVFNDYLEYEIDYSQPLSGNTGWKLKRNWRGVIPSTQYSTHRIKNITTFPNGRTYGRSQINGVTYELVEFVNNGVVRFTGVMLGQYGFLNPDGSKMVIENARNYKKYALNSIDVNNNPVWSTTGVYLSNIPTADANDPLIRNNNYDYPVTESGKLVSFDFSRIDASIGNEYHIGIVNPGGSSYMAKTARGTQRSYQGEFPRDGAFDNGNGVESYHRAGGSALTYKNSIFWGYHGEFWKQSQTNIWNQVDANTGLLVGQFGAIKKDFGGAVGGQEAPPEVAGNVFGGSVVEVNGNVYLYHNDEGINNGVHRWKINGLNTISVQNTTFPSTNTPENKGTNLLDGITRSLSTLPNNFQGWTRSPAVDETGATALIGTMSYDKLKAPDISFSFNKSAGNKMIVNKDLGDNSYLSQWSVKGKVNYQYNSMSEFDLSSASFLDVADVSGKQIARFDLRQSANQSGTYQPRGNDVFLTGGTTPSNVYSNRNENFEMSYINGGFTFSFAGYSGTTTNKADILANATAPKYFRFNAYTDGYQTPKAVSIQELYFTKTQGVPPPPSVSAGSDQSITLPTSTVTLSGSAVAMDTIASHTWTQVSGPKTGTITTAANYQTTITGLTTDGTYVFRLTATSSAAVSASDDISITVAPSLVSTVSLPPTNLFATAGNTQATLTFTTPTNTGTAPITSYIATSSPGNITKSGTASPLIITGLSNNVAYTFTIKAVTSVGSSLASNVSNTVTPVVPTGPVDTTAPVITPLATTINLPSDTTQTTLSLTTNEASSCRYSTSASTLYASMTPFTTTGGPTHSTIVTGLAKGTSTYFIRCADTSNNTTSTPVSLIVVVAAAPQSTGGGGGSSSSSSGNQTTPPQTPIVTPPTNGNPGTPITPIITPPTTQLPQLPETPPVSIVSVQTKGLNVRSEPTTTGKVVGQLPQYAEGVVIPRTETADGWVKARFSNGVEGYVNKKYAPIKVSVASTPSVSSGSGLSKVQVKVKGLKVRSLPNTTGIVLGQYPMYTQGTVIPGTETTDGWVKATFPNNIVGYVNTKYAPVMGTTPTTIRINIKGLNVRSLPNTTGKVLGQFPLNTQATIIPGTLTPDGWVKVTFPGGVTGYVNMKYVR